MLNNPLSDWSIRVYTYGYTKISHSTKTPISNGKIDIRISKIVGKQHQMQMQSTPEWIHVKNILIYKLIQTKHKIQTPNILGKDQRWVTHLLNKLYPCWYDSLSTWSICLVHGSWLGCDDSYNTINTMKMTCLTCLSNFNLSNPNKSPFLIQIIHSSTIYIYKNY